MFLDIEEGKVFVKKGGMSIPSLLDLYNSDKRPGKSYFEKCITLMYHRNKRDHELCNLGPIERLERIKKMYFPEYDIKKITENNKYLNAEDDYICLEYTPSQRLYEGIKKTIEHWKIYMANIPMTKEMMYNGNHEVVIDSEDGPKKVIIPIKAKIQIDNTEEYLKAMKNAEDILEREEKMRKRIINESQKAKVSEGDSMLQSGDFNHMLKLKRTL